MQPQPRREPIRFESGRTIRLGDRPKLGRRPNLIENPLEHRDSFIHDTPPRVYQRAELRGVRRQVERRARIDPGLELLYAGAQFGITLGQTFQLT